MSAATLRMGGLPLIRVKIDPDGRPQVLTANVRDETFSFPVVDAPRLTQENHDILPSYDLPMLTGVPILPTQSAQLARYFQPFYKIWRFVISSAGTSGGAADWIVNDLKINGVSQFNDVRQGAVFAVDAPDVFLRFPSSPTVTSVVMLMVTYIGLNEKGCPFFGSFVPTDEAHD